MNYSKKSERQNSTYNKITMGIVLIVILAYGIGLSFLFYNQLFFGVTGRFESDLPFHIQMAVEDGWFYSLTGIIYGLFYSTPFGNILTVIFLTAISLLTVYFTYRLLSNVLKRYDLNIRTSAIWGLSIIANVIMPFYVKVAASQRYVGYQSPSIWHNSTYICMKLMAVICMDMALKLFNKYKTGLNFKEWFSFCIILCITNFIKPSFYFVFAPVCAFIFLFDLLKKVPFKKVFIFGLSFIPAALLILFQNSVLFGNDTGNTIVINPGYALSMRGEHPKVSFVLSLAFCLLVLVFNFKDIFKDRLYSASWAIWLFGFIQVFMLAETGSRAKDSNFFWGYSISLFVIYLCSIIKMTACNKAIILCSNKKKKAFLISQYALYVIVLLYQVYCGIFFFIELLSGITYFM